MAVGQVEYKTTKAMAEIVQEDQGVVDCIFAVMGNVDLGGDQLLPGAFSKTFLESGHKVKVLDQHNAGSIMAVLGRPVELREVGRDELPELMKMAYPEAVGGAKARIQFLLDTPEGLGAFRRIKAGAVDEWSFAYRAINPEYVRGQNGETVRRLSEVRLLEISPVIWGMNPATTTTNAKACSPELSLKMEEEPPAEAPPAQEPPAQEPEAPTSTEECPPQEPWVLAPESPATSEVEPQEPEPEAPVAEAVSEAVPEAKAGRVMAARNQKRLKQIFGLLAQVSSLMCELEEDGGFPLEEEEPGSAELSKDVPSKAGPEGKQPDSESAAGAGPDGEEPVAPPTTEDFLVSALNAERARIELMEIGEV